MRKTPPSSNISKIKKNFSPNADNPSTSCFERLLFAQRTLYSFVYSWAVKISLSLILLDLLDFEHIISNGMLQKIPKCMLTVSALRAKLKILQGLAIQG